MITLERMEVLVRLVEKFRGPVSVALHLNEDDDQVAAVKVLYDVHSQNQYFREYVDLHLIIDKYDR